MIIDEQGNPIDNPDLENGYLIGCKIVKPSAYDTIDNVTKFALADDDYMDAQRYIVIDPVDKTNAQISERKMRLSETDYVVTKNMEFVMQASSTKEMMERMNNFKTENAELIAERQTLRDEVNALEMELAK